MSVKMIQAFKKTDLPSTDRLVAFMLADHHNESTGRCDPSIALLAAETGLCERSVRRAIRRIEEAGHLTIDDRIGVRHKYDLHPGLSVTRDTESPRTLDTKTPDSDDTGPRTLSPQTPDPKSSESEEPELEPEESEVYKANNSTPSAKTPREENDPIAIRLFGILDRPIHLRMNRDERALLRRSEIIDADLLAVEAYFAVEHPEWNGRNLRYKDLSALLKKWPTAVTTSRQWTRSRSGNGDDFVWEPNAFQRRLNVLFGRAEQGSWSLGERQAYQADTTTEIDDDDMTRIERFYKARKISFEESKHRPVAMLDFLKNMPAVLDAARRYRFTSAAS